MPEIPAYVLVHADGKPVASFNGGKGLIVETNLGNDESTVSDVAEIGGTKNFVSVGGAHVFLARIGEDGAVKSTKLIKPLLVEMESGAEAIRTTSSLLKKGSSDLASLTAMMYDSAVM